MTLRFLLRAVWHAINPWLCKPSYGTRYTINVCTGCGRRLKEAR